jgi:hypothetical protein
LFNTFLSRKWLHTLLRKRWNPLLRPTPPQDARLDDELQRALIDEVRDDIQALRRASGLPLAGWCV